MSAPEFVYRLIEPVAWSEAKNLATLPYAEIDERDGYLHLSTFGQMLATAARYYAHAETLLALEIPLQPIAHTVRFEKATNDEAFPHLYGALSIADIKQAIPLVRTASGAFVVDTKGE